MCRRNEVRTEERTLPGGNYAESGGYHLDRPAGLLTSSFRKTANPALTLLRHITEFLDEINNDQHIEQQRLADSSTAVSQLRNSDNEPHHQDDEKLDTKDEEDDKNEDGDNLALEIESITLYVGQYDDEPLPIRWSHCRHSCT